MTKVNCFCAFIIIYCDPILINFLFPQGGSEKTHPTDRFTQLITDNMSEENCLSYPILGIELFLQDCIEEARFIVDRVLHIMVENQFPLVEADSEGDLEGTKLIDLALYLYGEQGDRVSDGTFKQILTLSGYVPESELVALVEYLCQLIEDGTLDSTEFLIKLSNPIIETGLHRFTSKNFLRMVQLYEKHTDHDMVKLFWEKVCSDCIANSESKLPCVFCKILTEALPDYAERDEVLRTVSRASNAKQAISSSSKKFNPAVQENAAECFIYSISMLNDVAQLSDDDQLNTVLSNLLPTMDSKTLCQVGWFLFTSKTGVFDKQSTMRRVFEDVLRRITSLEGIGETYIFKAFRMFAWLGDLNLLETIYAKILREKNQCPTPKKEMCLVRLVFSALKGCIAGQTSDAASALNFNRKVFNFLLSRCVASVEVLEYSRASSFSRAFKAFLKAEKNFIDSSEASVTDAFSRVAHRLTPFEAMKIIKVLYLHESSNGHVEPSLKKFPPCWQVFQQLSRKAIDHFTQKPFSSTRFSANDAVTLMHCFFYVGEEEQIAKFCEFVCAGDTEEPRVGLRLCNIDKRIIMHSDTVPLALATPHGTVALMELIGNRIQRLTRRLCKNNHKGHEKEIQSLKSLRRTILLCIIQGKDTSKGKDVHV